MRPSKRRLTQAGVPRSPEATSTASDRLPVKKLSYVVWIDETGLGPERSPDQNAIAGLVGGGPDKSFQERLDFEIAAIA